MLFDEADPGALYVVASGEVSLETDGAPALRAGPGDTLGVREALAGVSGGRARAEAAGFALRLEGEALLELLAGDTALLQGIFGALLESCRQTWSASGPRCRRCCIASKPSAASLSGVSSETTIPTRNDSGIVTRPGF